MWLLDSIRVYRWNQQLRQAGKFDKALVRQLRRPEGA